MRVNDVIVEYGAPGSRALGAANFTTMMNHLDGRQISRNLRLDLGNDKEIEINDEDLDHIIAHYNSLPSTELKKDFVYGVMSRGSRLVGLLDRLGAKYTINQGQQGGLLEDPKKKQEPELSRDTVKDPKLAVALRKAYAKQPNAGSDIEALFRQDLESQAATQDELERQVSINRRQQQNLETLRDLARKQSQLLKDLDSENSDQNRELNDLEKEIRDLAGKSIDRSEQPSARRRRSRVSFDTDRVSSLDKPSPDTSAAAEPRTAEPAKTDRSQSINRRTEPFEPAGGGASIVPFKPRGPGPSGGAGALQLPYTPAAPSKVGTPATPSAPMSGANRPTIDLLPRVPDLTDRRQANGTRDIELAPSPALDVTAANDEEVPSALQRRVAEDLGRLRTLSGIK